MRLTRRNVNMGLAAGLATSAFSPIARAGGDTIKVGMVVSVTGSGADSGKYALTGARIALERVNKSGGALGKPIELIPEDDQTTNPGAVLAFSKLAAQPDIVAFIGQIRSTQTHAMAPDILKVGKPVCFGGTEVRKRLRRPILGQKLLDVERNRRRPDAFAILRRRDHAVGNSARVTRRNWGRRKSRPGAR
jgi:ABC-type branched-subunit amino acid transport system substrate-binding protein